MILNYVVDIYRKSKTKTMATISVTQILGGDNIAGSRVTINSNFNTIVNAINSQGTYLDTSATPGAALNVGSALVKAYTRPTTTQIFTCEATGLFGGNLTVGQDTGITRDLTVGRNTILHGTLTIDGSGGGTGSSILSSIPFSQDAANINPQFYSGGSINSLSIDPTSSSSLSGTGTTKTLVTTSSFNKVNTIRLNYSNYTGVSPYNCSTIKLPNVSDANVANGQILNLLIDAVSSTSGTTGTFGIDTSNWLGGYTQALFNGTSTNATNPILFQSIITVFADSNGWRVLNVFGHDCSVY